jgi:hypothetical protein
VETTANHPLQIPQIELLELVAYLHLRYGDPSRAQSYLDLLSRLLPANPRIMRSLAIAHLRMSHPDKAMDMAIRAASMEDSDQGRTASQFVLGIASSGRGIEDSAPCEEFLRMKSTLPKS